MSQTIAALPMYDWPEIRAETDAGWAAIRHRLHDAGVDAPETLTRDIRDLGALWRDPELLLAQACWGPMGLGLAEYVQVVGQPDYSDCEGGNGTFYSSALVMRAKPDPASGVREKGIRAPTDGRVLLPVDLLRGTRLGFNSRDSMSGYLALQQDLATLGESLSLFSGMLETGGHRQSMQAVAGGRADVAAIDCRSWMLFQRVEPAVTAGLQVVGWTAWRKGLPFITARSTPHSVVVALQEALTATGNST